LGNDWEKERLKNFAAKSEMERTIAVGLHGAPELKYEEKKQHLGEFRERILKLLTKAQVMENKIYPEIVEALQDQRATKMLINGDIAYQFRSKYQKIASELGKSYTVVHDPELKGDAGLVVAADQAVDEENIYISQ